MYVSFLQEIPKENFIKYSNIIKTDVYLESKEEMDNIYEFIEKFGLEKFQSLFDIIGIKYVSIENGGSAYKISSGKLLHLYDLSSGERLMLYSLVMSQLGKPFLVIGLADRLDKKHMDILMNLSDMFSTTVIMVEDYTVINQDIVNAFHVPFNELIKRGIV